ncbi:DUF533 domain-containing protein [Methylobacterium trifolii]|nr:DUF533 domain-containing protein [Methylobacterium trifolii]
MVDALIRERRGSSIAATAAMGGFALVVGLALKAVKGSGPASDRDASAEAPGPHASPTPFDHADVGEDEARLMLRAMVAATMADGLLDAAERKRLDAAMAAAGIGDDGRAWLEKELADPAGIDQLADPVKTAEQAARIYAAARLAIDLDTLQERQFLKMLAEALDVPSEAVARVEQELAA